MKNEEKKRPTVPHLVVVAVVVCLAVYGIMFVFPKDTNSFFIKAYTIDETEGRIRMREVKLLDQPDVWGGSFDGEYFYINVGLRYEGENIQSVEFFTPNGFFAKQYISQVKPEDNASRLYVGEDNRLVLVGNNFEKAGDKIILDDKTQSDDLLLFWGMEASNTNNRPEKIEISATATFHDAHTQEETIIIDLSETMGVYRILPSD